MPGGSWSFVGAQATTISSGTRFPCVPPIRARPVVISTVLDHQAPGQMTSNARLKGTVEKDREVPWWRCHRRIAGIQMIHDRAWTTGRLNTVNGASSFVACCSEHQDALLKLNCCTVLLSPSSTIT